MAALKITGQSAEPTVTDSDAGTLYYDSDTNKLRHYNGTAWADVSPAIASADFPAGTITNFQGFQNSTRATLSNTTIGTFFTVSYNKLQAASTLYVSAVIAGRNDAAGHTGIGFKYGGSANIWSGTNAYARLDYMRGSFIQGYLSGHTTTGSQTLTLQYGGGSGATRPFEVINPNSSDSQTELPSAINSSVFVWEVL